MSITDYVNRRVEIEITARDRATNEPVNITGNVVVVAEREGVVVAANVSVTGPKILVLFNGTLAQPGTWHVQANEIIGGTPDVIWSDQIVIVPAIDIAGIASVSPQT